MKRLLLRSAFVSAVVATVMAGFFTYVAGREDLHCEFCSASGALSPWLLFKDMFLIAFGEVFAACFLVAMVLAALLRRRSGPPEE